MSRLLKALTTGRTGNYLLAALLAILFAVFSTALVIAAVTFHQAR